MQLNNPTYINLIKSLKHESKQKIFYFCLVCFHNMQILSALCKSLYNMCHHLLSTWWISCILHDILHLFQQTCDMFSIGSFLRWMESWIFCIEPHPFLWVRHDQAENNGVRTCIPIHFFVLCSIWIGMVVALQLPNQCWEQCQFCIPQPIQMPMISPSLFLCAVAVWWNKNWLNQINFFINFMNHHRSRIPEHVNTMCGLLHFVWCCTSQPRSPQTR